jgi:transcriptional regulator with XRE-family HTH domain
MDAQDAVTVEEAAETFAAEVAYWREVRGMSKKALAEQMSFHPSYVSHVESGRNTTATSHPHQFTTTSSAASRRLRSATYDEPICGSPRARAAQCRPLTHRKEAYAAERDRLQQDFFCLAVLRSTTTARRPVVRRTVRSLADLKESEDGVAGMPRHTALANASHTDGNHPHPR